MADLATEIKSSTAIVEIATFSADEDIPAESKENVKNILKFYINDYRLFFLENVGVSLRQSQNKDIWILLSRMNYNNPDFVILHFILSVSDIF